jgi:calcium-dependent protein kinase
LHDLDIAHRDLKPENILFCGTGNDIKLIDFGMSKICNKNAQMNTRLGSPYYVAPEVLDGQYDKRCDLWSIGVITYILLCGEPPFFGESTAAVFKKIRKCEYDFSQDVWKSISRNAKLFVMKLIEPNLSLRMTVEQALQHPWMKP